MNPFTERSRITDPEHFAGRWRELSLVFERIETKRPVMLVGAPGIGKSSLLTHVAQSAAAVLELDELESFYLDLAKLPDAETCYRLVIQALGNSGDTPAALEVALLDADGPVLLCLDRVEAAVAAGWGEALLERLARIARSSNTRLGSSIVPGSGALELFLVAAAESPGPMLSEPFATLNLGALAPTEIRLIIDAYLDGTGIVFSPAELSELSDLSTGHPAYLQRAAFHLFTAKVHPGYDWRAAYLEEARERPIPGAPLPPAVFEGDRAMGRPTSLYGESAGQSPSAEREPLRIEGVGSLLIGLLPLLAALLALQFSGSWLLAGILLVVGVAIAVVATRQRAKRGA